MGRDCPFEEQKIPTTPLPSSTWMPLGAAPVGSGPSVIRSKAPGCDWSLSEQKGGNWAKELLSCLVAKKEHKAS